MYYKINGYSFNTLIYVIYVPFKETRQLKQIQGYGKIKLRE